VVEVREPLVMISQIQRSGGTLLSQLFDAHPECHAHPWELEIGYPNSRRWPPIDLDAPERWFEVLFEGKAVKHFLEGYCKAPGDAWADVFPFCFLPRLQKAIFDQCAAARPVARERDVLDCYFTSYFNAWIDNHNLYTGPKRVVTGFVSRMNMKLENVERYFAAYPDGTMISSVREPAGWYSSASRKYGFDDVETGFERWRVSAAATLAAHERWGDRVVVVTFERLVRETEETMRRIADRIGISMHPSLLTPTFNGRPIRANSMDPIDRHGIVPERVAAHGTILDAATIDRVEELADDLYEQACALSV